MSTQPADVDPIDASLTALEKALGAWDPDEAPAVGPMISALRELLVRFDPRRERVASSLAVVAMKLLEEIDGRGNVSSQAAVGAVGELATGLRETFKNAAASATPARGRHANEVVLSLPKAGGLSLSLGVESNLRLGEVMLKMRLLTAEQIDRVLSVQAESEPRKRFGEIAVELGFTTAALLDSALRMQARSRGEEVQAAQNDPWGA